MSVPVGCLGRTCSAQCDLLSPPTVDVNDSGSLRWTKNMNEGGRITQNIVHFLTGIPMLFNQYAMARRTTGQVDSSRSPHFGDPLMPLCGFTSSRAGAEHLTPCHGSVIALYAFAVTARLAMALRFDLESPSGLELALSRREHIGNEES